MVWAPYNTRTAGSPKNAKRVGPHPRIEDLGIADIAGHAIQRRAGMKDKLRRQEWNRGSRTCDHQEMDSPATNCSTKSVSVRRCCTGRSSLK